MGPPVIRQSQSHLRRAAVKLTHLRLFSTKAHLIEIDLSSSQQPSPSSSSSSNSVERQEEGIKKLEELMQRLMVQRHTPDWIPFLPGSSFWVPPPSAGCVSVGELVRRIANPLSDEEENSVTSFRGWPSSNFFSNDGPGCSDKIYTSDEEEG